MVKKLIHLLIEANKIDRPTLPKIVEADIDRELGVLRNKLQETINRKKDDGHH